MNEQQHEGLLPEGTLLSGGKYRVEAYLASGGFGNTYLANDMAFNEKVVIKELFIKGVCGRDHTTVMHAVRKITQERAGNAELNHEIHVLEQMIKG